MYLAGLKREEELKEENKKLKNAKIVVARDAFQQKVRETTEKFREMVNAMGEENKKLKDQVKYLEDEVCRYSNAIEEEYVLKTDYEELEEELADKEVLAKAYKENKIEIMKLKEANDTFTLGAKRAIESNCKLYQENEKLKKEVSDNELETRKYRERVLEEYGEDAEALEPQYHRFCEWCKETRLGINEHIFIYEKDGVDSKTLCQECGEPNTYHTSPYSQLKKEGYTCDEDE